MKKTKGKKRFALIIGTIWGLTFAALIIGVIYVFTGYEYDYYNSPRTSLEQLAYGKYGTVYTNIVYGMRNEPEIYSREDYKELIALADYIEAAGTYRIFEAEGDSDRMAKAKEKMETSGDKLGLISFTKDDLNEIYGLNE